MGTKKRSGNIGRPKGAKNKKERFYNVTMKGDVNETVMRRATTKEEAITRALTDYHATGYGGNKSIRATAVLAK